jgi:hypothetical protein
LLAALLLVLAPCLRGAEPGDRVFFSRSFPGSIPAYFEISVRADGAAEYREAPDEDPLAFTLSEGELQEVFGLAEKLERFGRSVQSDAKVAFTGTKTLRYTSASGETTEAQFSYTVDPDAQGIKTWFENAGETARHRIELERAARFDPLGVNKALLLFQSSFDGGHVVAPEQLLPILERIAASSKYMHMARVRAAALIERIKNPPPQ